jgi:hypothetical protein
MAKEMGIDDFLGHRTSSGGGSNFLGNWKKREGDSKRTPVPLPPASVDTWLHRKCGIVSIWRHNFPRKVVKEDKDTKEKEIKFWSGNHVCWEHEDLLKQQFKRDRDTGRRIAPPKVCGICKFLEWLQEQVAEGNISWTDEAFRFEPDEDDPIILHVGGMYGAFGAKDMSDEQKKELRKAKIFLTDAWKENVNAKASYVFRVVDHDNPDKGVQVAIETALLGDKVRLVINDSMSSLGSDEGNPLKHPYAIRWTHRDKEKEFHKKLHAQRIDRLELTDEIEALITDTDPPAIDHVTKRFDWRKVKAEMMEHCVLEVDVPWDDLFAAHESESEEDDEAPESEKPKAKSNGKHIPPTVKSKKKPEPEEEEMLACDECDKPMKASADECPHCGHKYDVAGEEEEKPEPKKLPKRSEARKAAPTPPAKGKKSKAADDDEGDEGGVPF